MNRSTIFILIAALLAGFAGFSFSRYQMRAQADHHTEAASAPMMKKDEMMKKQEMMQKASSADASGMPDFSLVDLEGQTRTPLDYAGKPMLVNFWATWCAPCRKEMPELMALHEERGDDIQVVGIAMDRAHDVAEFVEELAIGYPNLIADDLASSELIAAFGNPQGMLPFTVFIDAEGAIQERHLGPITLDQIEAKLPTLGL